MIIVPTEKPKPEYTLFEWLMSIALVSACCLVMIYAFLCHENAMPVRVLMEGRGSEFQLRGLYFRRRFPTARLDIDGEVVNSSTSRLVAWTISCELLTRSGRSLNDRRSLTVAIPVNPGQSATFSGLSFGRSNKRTYAAVCKIAGIRRSGASQEDDPVS